MKRASLALIAALCLTSPGWGQAARFEGWDAMRSSDFRFDPDERAVMLFALQTAPAARAALERAEQLLADGESLQAARQLLDVVGRFGAEALQVSEDPERGGGRWVGAGEWALYQLLTRVPDSVLEQLATPEERARLATATRWRDLDSLRDLATRLEGLPEGRAAAVTLARLLAEAGHETAAAAAARRATAMGAAPPLPPDLGVEPPAEPVGPLLAGNDEPLDSHWVRVGSRWEGHPTTMARLVETGSLRQNPFVDRVGPREAPIAPLEPVVRDGVVYLTDAISVSALDLISGRRLWHHRGPLEVREDEGRFGEHFELSVYASNDRPRAISPYQLARTTLVGDRLLVSLQAVDPWFELADFDNIPINHPLPSRRLVCLDRRTGEVLWRQERPDQAHADFVNRLDVYGPPVVSGGLVYVAGSITEGAINAYAAAFDLETGDLAWQTLLCTGQQELTMFNRPFQEHVLSPPSLHDGRLMVCTNLGVVASLDAWSGRLRWLSSYEAIERRSSRNVRPDTVRPIYWRPDPPFVEGGVLVVAPIDSQWLLGLDPDTGRRVWQSFTFAGNSHRSPVRHQAVPTGDGRVILVSDEGTECFETSTGETVWDYRPFGPRDECSGAAVLAGDELLVPADPWLLVIDAQSGRLKASLDLPETGPGRGMQRVLPAGPVLLMTDGESLLGHVSEELLRARCEPLARAGDERAILSLAELALATGSYDEAGAYFGRVTDAGEPELEARARGGLVAAAWSRARMLDTPEAWDGVMRAAPSPEILPLLGDSVLPSLARLGDDALLVHWLAEVARVAPEHPVTLDQDGPRPASQALVLRRLPLEPPASAVGLLSGLIEQHAAGTWGGLPVSVRAERRIAELLERHGRGIYAEQETAAQALSDSGASLDVVERLYPNALLVERGRAEILETMLAEGRARDVFAQAAGSRAPSLLALRARAARELGEDLFADVLEGRPAPPPASLPALPPDGSGSLLLTLHETRDVELASLPGRPSPELAGYAVGCVDGLGELFCIDTRAGRVAWSGIGLPGGAYSLRSDVELFVQGDLLLLRGNNELVALGLADGMPRWSRVLVGDPQESVVAQGLVITLVESSLGAWRVEGHGVTSGLAAFRIDLPHAAHASLHRVGDEVMCITSGDYTTQGVREDRRLLLLDPPRGEVLSSSALGVRQKLLAVSHDPPGLLLSEQRGGSARLSAWDPRGGAMGWEYELGFNPNQRHLAAVTSGRAVLRESVPLPGGGRNRRFRDRLTLLDLRRGPVASPGDVPLLKLVDSLAPGAPQLVLMDPERPEGEGARLVVLDASSLALRYELQLDGLSLTERGMVLQSGSDGFVVMDSTLDQSRVDVWVVRGEGAEQRYSVTVDDLPGGGEQLLLVDGAVLLADGGSVRILRSTTP